MHLRPSRGHALPASYGSDAARALGLLDNVVTDKGHDVDVARLKLPPPGLAATFPLGDYLVDPAVRAAYLDPRTLELPRAAEEVTLCSGRGGQSWGHRGAHAEYAATPRWRRGEGRGQGQSYAQRS